MRRLGLRLLDRTPSAFASAVLRLLPRRFRPRAPRAIAIGATWAPADVARSPEWLSTVAEHRPATGEAPDVVIESGAALRSTATGRHGVVVRLPNDVITIPDFARNRPRPLLPPSSGVIRFPDRPPTSERAMSRLAARSRSAATVVVPAHWLADADGARTTLAVAAQGAPLHAEGERPTRPLLGPRTISALFEDARTDRELRSVRLRRAALLEHAPRAALTEIASRLSVAGPTTNAVSVLLATRRPADVLDAVDRVVSQQHVDTQLLVGLHGERFPTSIERQIAERCSGPHHVSRHAAGCPLGGVLAALADRADGSLIAKWDDDDWYDVEHLADLALAHGFSGAELVGKFAEFIYLEGSDLTLRRRSDGAERYGGLVAGGALLTSRTWLTEIGGWAPIPRLVDQQLMADTKRRGGAVYRTHGFGYVLRRRSDAGHTWAAPDAYFAAQARDRRTGLDLVFAGFSEPR